MRLILLLIAAGVLAVFSPPVHGIEDWVYYSNSSLNPMVTELILSDNQEIAYSALKALSEREDLYWEDIIESLIFRHPQDRRVEVFLEILIDKLLSGPPPRLRAWIVKNPEGYDLLIQSMGEFESPYLKARIIRMLPYSTTEYLRSSLMAECDQIADQLDRGQGVLSDGYLRELLAVFDVIKSLGDRDFLYMAIRLTSLSVQKRAIDKGREIIRVLTAPGG